MIMIHLMGMHAGRAHAQRSVMEGWFGPTRAGVVVRSMAQTRGGGMTMSISHRIPRPILYSERRSANVRAVPVVQQSRADYGRHGRFDRGEEE